MARKRRGYTNLKRTGYGDPNRPTRESDYGPTGEYSAAYKAEFHPGRTARGTAKTTDGNGKPLKPPKLSDLITGPKVTTPNFGSFKNTMKDSPRAGQAFEIVHRDGKRYHKYASGRLVADKVAGSGSERIKRKKTS